MSSETYHRIVLPDVGGHGSSVATGINNAGDIVGYSYTGSGEEAVEWLPTGVGGPQASVAPHVAVSEASTSAMRRWTSADAACGGS